MRMKFSPSDQSRVCVFSVAGADSSWLYSVLFLAINFTRGLELQTFILHSGCMGWVGRQCWTEVLNGAASRGATGQKITTAT